MFGIGGDYAVIHIDRKTLPVRDAKRLDGDRKRQAPWVYDAHGNALRTSCLWDFLRIIGPRTAKLRLFGTIGVHMPLVYRQGKGAPQSQNWRLGIR